MPAVTLILDYQCLWYTVSSGLKTVRIRCWELPYRMHAECNIGVVVAHAEGDARFRRIERLVGVVGYVSNLCEFEVWHVKVRLSQRTGELLHDVTHVGSSGAPLCLPHIA